MGPDSHLLAGVLLGLATPGMRPTRSVINLANAATVICNQCRGHRTAAARARRLEISPDWRQQLSYSARQKRENDQVDNVLHHDAARAAQAAPNSTLGSIKSSAPHASRTLPSHAERQRWPASKRLSRLMDMILARASVAGHHINIYTGTDYSGIETLRSEIAAQEQALRGRISASEEAKAQHQEAHAHQATAQREIVGLLERKASWSPTDLERYMALVRSEHVNDQAVQAAKDNLTVTEKDLAEARSLLERLERKQYHEEQIWSDTIRRNSTWVTFGLMGLNIILLLAQIAVFEPYRRKRIVQDVKAALDEKSFSIVSTDSKGIVSEASSDTLGAVSTSDPLQTLLPTQHEAGDAPIAVTDLAPQIVADFASAAPSGDEKDRPDSSFSRTLKAYEYAIRDQFSQRLVQLRKIDVTTTAVLGAITGTAMTSIVFVVLRSR